MEDYGTLQKLIEELRRIILDLKTTYSIGPSVQSYYESFTPTSAATAITITYAAGTQPIISNVFAESTAVLGPVNDDNTQQIFWYGQAPTSVQVVSTRPIESITQS